ncbi:MAG TPA: penicillin-binding protein 1C [Puia sp.]|nr:penicillin-binding protein 1C [Puia sp.]
MKKLFVKGANNKNLLNRERGRGRWWRWTKRGGIGVAGLFFLFLLLNWVFPLPDRIEYSTIVTDNKGEVIHAFLTHDQQWRMKTDLGEISPLLRKTIVEKEDKYFYYHPGVNPVAMVKACARNIFARRRTSGASTITMQVARALEPKRRTYWGKLVEVFRAFQLEWKYSKDQILQLYLNKVPYGGNIQGVKSASILYFGKNPDHLSLAEITALSVIPNRPSSLVLGRHNDLIVAERNKWLRRWAREGVFAPKEIEDALAEPLTARRGVVPSLVPQLAWKLKKRGQDVVHSTIELNTQLKIEKLVKDYSRTLTLKNIRNAAVVVIDNRTRQVVSYVGSADFHDSTDAGQVNGAAAIRQPGSTLKPLLYGLCFDAGLLTPKMTIEDVPVNYNGFTPENYDRKFNGYVTVEYALGHSLNIPAVKSLRALGTDVLIHKLVQCDFRQVDKDRDKLGLSMILGGCGATLEELTGMYSIFAHEGMYVRPVYSFDDTALGGPAAGGALRNAWRPADGAAVPASAGAAVGRRILSPAAAFMINEMLSRVNRPDFPVSWESTMHLPKIAWKTGTSYGRRDAWSIGYNKKYTVGVWVGNFSGVGIPELSGANVATPLLFTVFNTIDYDADDQWFSQPPDCDIRMVCTETGLPPADFCAHLVTDYFIPLVSPARKCDNMEEVFVSADEKVSYCRTCLPEAGYKKKLYKVMSPEMRDYNEANKIAFVPIPPHNPACEKLFREGGPVVVSPANGSEYLINKKDPEPVQLQCKAGNDVGKVYWYINDKFYKGGDAGVKQFFFPTEGPVKISVTDDKGRNRNIWIRVKFVDL